MIEKPSLLDEFELPGDVGIEAHKEQPALDIVVLVALLDRAAVFAAAPKYPMIIGGIEQCLNRRHILCQAVARVGPADVRAERAAKPLRIGFLEQKIVSREIELVRRQDLAV